MTAHFVKIGCLLWVASGCAARHPHFETSDAPPEEPPADVPLREFQVPAESVAEPRYRLEVTTTQFLLALQNRAPEQLENLLMPGALVREESSASGNAALPVLLDLAGTWSATRETEPGSADPAIQAFGPTRIVELVTQGSETWATVEVEGPPKVQGLWKIRLGEANSTLRVSEVILPKGN